MIAAFRSELLKLRARTYLIGVAGMAAFMVVTMLISVGGADDEPSDRGPAGLILARTDLVAADGLARSLGNGVTFLGIAALTLTCINVGTEHSAGTVRNLLLRQPRRARLMVGKTLALLVYTAAGVVIASLIGAAAAFGFAAADDLGTSAWITAEGVVATVGGVGNLVVGVGGWAALGVLLGVALRAAPAAIGVGVAYALPAEILLVQTLGESSTWLPGQSFQALARGGVPWLEHAPALGRSVGWAVLAIGVAVLTFRQRDLAN